MGIFAGDCPGLVNIQLERVFRCFCQETRIESRWGLSSRSLRDATPECVFGFFLVLALPLAVDLMWLLFLISGL